MLASYVRMPERKGAKMSARTRAKMSARTRAKRNERLDSITLEYKKQGSPVQHLQEPNSRLRQWTREDVLRRRSQPPAPPPSSESWAAPESAAPQYLLPPTP